MPITDTYITIRGLRVFARHGVMETEKSIGNEFIVDAVIHYDAAHAMVKDDIRDAIDYSRVIKIIRQEMAKPAKLLEHVVWHIINAIIADMPGFPCITGMTVTVTKECPPIPGNTASASFTADWTRAQSRIPPRQIAPET